MLICMFQVGYPLFIYSDSYDEHVRKTQGKLVLDRN
jgi:hypothetical protein